MTGRTATKPERERIGEPGVVWATRYAGDRWTVFGHLSGVIVAGVSKAQAERLIANFEQSRTIHPSQGATP